MPTERVRAWRPSVPGIVEALHARFTRHAYPAHVHDHWTVLLLDRGAVDYTLERSRRRALTHRVSVLPPGVAHDGRSATASGFTKRVVYLDERWLPARLTGAAVREPQLADARLAGAVSALHDALGCPDDALEAESRLALVVERITAHLAGSEAGPSGERDRGLARLVRRRLDEDQPTLEAIARELGTHPSHLVRTFRAEYGLPPHRYLIGQRVDRARQLLLGGMPIAQVATEVGFHDQAHLTRHFRRVLGVPPGTYRGAA